MENTNLERGMTANQPKVASLQKIKQGAVAATARHGRYAITHRISNTRLGYTCTCYKDGKRISFIRLVDELG